MLPIGSSLNDVAGMITAAGVPAAVDARNLVIPGAWVTPGVVSFETMQQSKALMVFDVYLIAPDHGPEKSLNDLGDMLDKVRDALPVAEATPVMVNLPNHGADALPALQISIEAEITED